MRRTTSITWNVTGQQVSLRLPNGRPTAATFQVFRQYATDDSTAEFSGAATIDTAATTLSAAAGQAQTDPQLLPLAAVAGFATNKRYQLTQNGLTEWVELIQIGASSVRSRQRLENNYTTGATFQSTYISALIDPTWIAQLQSLSDLVDTTPDFRVRWTITVGGVTVIAYTFFDVVRVAVNHHVDIGDVNDRAPGLADSMPVEYQPEDGRPLLDAAWKAVRADFVAISIAPDSLRDDEAIDELVVLRSLRVLAEGGWRPRAFDLPLYIKVTTDNYDRYWERHFAGALHHQVQYQLEAARGEQPRNPIGRDPWKK